MARGDGLKKWRDGLTEEQWQAHLTKLRASRKPKAAASLPAASPIDPVGAKYLPLFRTLLGQYLDLMAGMTALGNPQYEYCRLCSGGGIHIIGCHCPCHIARKALAEYDEATRTPVDGTPGSGSGNCADAGADVAKS